MNSNLGSVARFIRGVTFKPDDVVPLETDGSVNCMRTKNVQTSLDTRDVWAIPSNLVKRRDQYLQEGDLLISSANSWNLVGKACWIPTLASETTFGGFITALRPDPTKVNPRYLFHWFTSERVQATLRSFGQKTTNISNLNIGRCGEMEMPLPPLAKQHRIAAILDQAEELRSKRRAAIALLDQLPQSIFLEIFGDPATNPKGWPTRRFGDLACKFSDGPFGSNLKSSHYTPTGVRVWRLQNVGVGELVDHDRAFISEAHFAKLSKHLCVEGDVIVGTLGEPNLRAFVQPASIPRALNKADCVQMRPKPGVSDAVYICWLCNSRGMEQLAQSGIQGQTRLRISMGRLREIHVPVPPIELQRQFATYVEAVLRAKAAHKSALTQLDDLFSSLQNRSFGEGGRC